MPVDLPIACTSPDARATGSQPHARPRGGQRLISTDRALQAWMASEGPWSLDLSAYGTWASQQNGLRRPDQRFFPSALEVLDDQGDNWRELVRTKDRGVERHGPPRPDLESVRAWLASDPARPTRTAYAAWARAHRATGTWHASPDALQRSTRMTWQHVLAAVEDGPTWGDDRHRTRVSPYVPRLADDPPADLPTSAEVAPGDLVLLSEKEVIRRLPLPGAKRALHNGSLGLTPALSVMRIDFFYATDVEALRSDQTIPSRRRFELGEVLMHSGQVADLLRLSRSAVRMYIKRERWTLVPRPALRTQGFETWLWLRSDVEHFLDGRPHPHASDSVAQILVRPA